MSGRTEVGEDPSLRTARLLRDQAHGCEVFGSTLYGALLRHAAEDFLAGGPTAAVLAGHESDPGPSALALRLMGGVHALVLSGQAPDLAAYYPSVTPDARPLDSAGLDAFVDLLSAQREVIRTWLPRAPQTNEVGRGAALVGGLLHAVTEADLPIRLVEIGTSAGLNLRADHFHIGADSGGYGDPSSPVQLAGAWQGAAPPARSLHVLDRLGADLAPIEPTTDTGRLTLCAYVWADQVDRLVRLRGAIDLAATVPATLRTESALQTVQAIELADDTWTVLWHSVMIQYLDSDDRRAIDGRIAEIGATATSRRRFAHLSLEPRRRTDQGPFEFLVTLTTWPPGKERILATSAPHGVPVTWDR